jgi:hypothetical protein
MELGVARYADLTLLPYGPLAIDAIVSRQESPLVRPMGRAQGHLRTAQQHLAKGRRAQAAEEATAAGNVLFGSVIPSFEPLAALVGFHAFEWLGAGEAALAGEWLQLGLYVLPDNATLLATLGEIQTKTGNPEGGARALGRALERGTELSEALRTRATALLATP